MINDNNDDDYNNMIRTVHCKYAHMYISTLLVRGPEAGQNGDGWTDIYVKKTIVKLKKLYVKV
jgi:hypothetical protein